MARDLRIHLHRFVVSPYFTSGRTTTTYILVSSIDVVAHNTVSDHLHLHDDTTAVQLSLFHIAVLCSLFRALIVCFLSFVSVS